MMRMRNLIAAVALLLPLSAYAQTYPTKPVHIVVPYSPGGSTDLAARVLAAKLTDMWGQQVVIDNRPGGNGFIGMVAGAKGAPDGYTLTLATVGEAAISEALFDNTPYNMARDFVPISMVADADLVLVAAKDSPFNSVQDVFDGAKKQPGRLSVATPGAGTISQILLEWMSLNSGTKFQHIPYKGGGPGAAAVAGNNVPLGILSASGVTSYLKSGHLRVLAVFGTKKSSLDPSWPTLIESGVKDVTGSTWAALFAPKGTPPAIVEKINNAVVTALKSEDLITRYAGAGSLAVPSTPDELAARMKRESDSYSTIIKAANIRPE
jgi:tripartite-type tricarboxylate transporter receptor subunit TctC